jgi:hypothetical protein
VALTQINNEQISSASAGNASAGIDAGTKIQAGTVTGAQLANNISVTTTGNIAAGNILTNNYFYANGAPFSGGGTSTYGNANVADYLASGTDTAGIVTTGNISGAFILGNGSALTDISGPNVVGFVANATLADSANSAGTAATAGTVTTNAQPNITSVGLLSALDVTGNITSASGNVAGGYILGNVAFATGFPVLDNYGNANVTELLNTGIAGNLIPSANNLYSIGSLTNQWSSVYVSANTIYFNGFPLSSANATALTYNGQPIVTETAGGNISTDGNVAAGNVLADAYFFANGAPLTTYANADVSAYLASGNNTANIITTGNVSGAYLLGNGSALTAITGASVTGTVANATYALNANSSSFAGVAFSVDGANVVGEVAVANTVSNPNQPNITALGTITSLTADAVTINGLLTANSNAQFNGDVYFAGNVTIPGNINVISGNSGQFFGNVVTGFGALYAGLPAGYTLLNQEVMQFSDSFNGYTQVTHRNINGGDQATTDYVATADNGTDLINYVDLGIAGSGYNGLLANNSLGNSLFANDSYLYAQGNVAGGNLVLGTIRSGAVVRIITGASDLANVRATFSSTGLAVNGNVSAANLVVSQSIVGSGASPAPSLSGFSSIATTGEQGNISASGNLLTAGYVNAIGNVSAAYFLGNGSQLTDVVQALVKPNNLVYVAKNGSDSSGTGSINAPYLTVQAAIDAVAGDTATTIMLAPGSYVENLTIANVANSLNITGSGLSESAINGNITISGSSNNIEFDNFRISTGRVTHSATGYWSVLNMRFSANTGITKTSASTIKIFNTDLGAAGTGSVLLQAGKTNIYSSQVFNAQVSGAGTEVNFLQCDTVILPTVTAGNVNFINSVVVSSGTGNSLNAVGGNITLTSSLSITPTRTLAPINFGAGSTYRYGDSAFDYANTTFAGTPLPQDAQFQAINVRGGNVVTTGNISGTYILGNGSQLTDITGTNVVGNVTSAITAGTVTTNAQPNITSVGTLSTLDVTGNVTAGGIVTTGTSGNITGAFAVVANYFAGDGSNITNVTATRVAANALTGNTLSANVLNSSLTSLGSLTALTMAGNITTDYSILFGGASALAYTALSPEQIALKPNVNDNLAGLNFFVDQTTADLYATDSVNISTDTAGAGYSWNFSSDGALSAPGNIGTTGNVVAAYLYGDGSNVTNVTANPVNTIVNGTSDVTIATANSNVTVTTAGTSTFTFDTTGNLTLPSDTAAINYANGVSILSSAVAEAAFIVESANFNAVEGARYGVNTAGGNVTATLPATPATGSAIFFADAGGAFATNNLTVDPDGGSINGISDVMTVNTNNQSFGLFYNGTTWRTY